MTPSVPSPFAFYWPNPGQPSVEGILIHELGHVSFGFDDQTAGNSSPRGVMWGMIPDGPVGYWLHLYRADQDTAIFGGAGSSGEGMGATLQRTAVQEIDASGAWVGTSPELLADLRTTFGPALATRHSNSGYWGSAFLMRSTRGAGYAFSSGLPSSWLFEGALNNYWLATAQSNHSSVGLAYSRYDEVTGAWFECSMLTSNNCIVVTAMRAPGSAWQEHVHYQPTIARPEVAYDAWTDRFVLLFIHEDGRLWTSSTPAWGVQWTAPAPLVFSDGATRHFRYMGGLVFEYLPPGGPPGAPGVPYGWAFAASADPRADGVLTPIVQMALSYQTATSSYVAGVPALPIPGSSAAAFDTIRHFDVGDAMDGDAHVLAFLRASYAPWQQRVVTSRRVGATGTFTVPVEMSWYRSGAITSSVAVSHNANLNNRFVIGVGGEP